MEAQGADDRGRWMADSVATVPVTLQIDYDLLKKLLHLPDDVKVLGVVGVKDDGGSFPLLVETPARHIKRTNLKVQYKQSAKVDVMAAFDRVEFDGFI